jgi:hypothetical protein
LILLLMTIIYSIIVLRYIRLGDQPK